MRISDWSSDVCSSDLVVGYEVDLCKEIANYLGVKLEVKMISVAARIPELVAGRVDVVAANLGWSPDRAKQIDYSYADYVSPQKILKIGRASCRERVCQYV